LRYGVFDNLLYLVLLFFLFRHAKRTVSLDSYVGRTFGLILTADYTVLVGLPQGTSGRVRPRTDCIPRLYRNPIQVERGKRLGKTRGYQVE
jgi:hypothetical protein